ncbi:uncharacterized protein B0H64DRAFT_193570 [Chaetomium fimeti]|uniref:Hikeshi-like domain-containing protein n=1 Tax=Chaetomium fimeti TaxID=1854472 RepID=A0AAE0HDW9_9PEZI|nr:hypothetical protein B0H64DRAFT_193570 [Chaetomium fimeti]
MATPLFGLLPAGYPVITTPTQTPSPTSFIYAFPPTRPFSHIAVFFLPDAPRNDQTAAAIYLITPPSPGQVEPNHKFLGGIGQGKDSAIFKLGPAAAGGGDGSGGNVVIGVSLEPAESVGARVMELSAAAAAAGASSEGSSSALVRQQQQQPSTLVLAQRIIKNAFNFLAGFSGTAGQVEVVPLKAFEEWWRKFEGRVRSDPGFLERDD